MSGVEDLNPARGFDAKRKADYRMPVAGGDEHEGSAKRNNPSALQYLKCCVNSGDLKLDIGIFAGYISGRGVVK